MEDDMEFDPPPAIEFIEYKAGDLQKVTPIDSMSFSLQGESAWILYEEGESLSF